MSDDLDMGSNVSSELDGAPLLAAIGPLGRAGVGVEGEQGVGEELGRGQRDVEAAGELRGEMGVGLEVLGSEPLS